MASDHKIYGNMVLVSVVMSLRMFLVLYTYSYPYRSTRLGLYASSVLAASELALPRCPDQACIGWCSPDPIVPL